MDAKISVIIPVYNVEKYLRRCVDSVKSQTYSNLEIILVDDGSKDLSGEICDQYMNIDERIRVIHKENGGLSSARNAGLDCASGDYIGFVDADDLIEFRKYEKVFEVLLNSDYDFFIKSFDANKLNKLDRDKLYQFLVEKEVMNSPCMRFYKKSILESESIRFEKSLSLGEDLLFNVNYFEKCDEVGFFSDDLYCYRNVNNNSLTQRYCANKLEMLTKVYEKCCECCSSTKAIDSFEYIRIKNYFSCLKSEIIYNKKNNKQLIEYIRCMKKYKKIRFIRTAFFRHGMVYYIWYLCCPMILVYICKMMLV